MGNYGMSDPKPGPIKGLSRTTVPTDSQSDCGGLGASLADFKYTVPGNPPKGMLGGDNRHDTGKFAAPGNPDSSGFMSANPGWPGDTPAFDGVDNGSNLTPAQLKQAFRNGSDALGMDSGR